MVTELGGVCWYMLLCLRGEHKYVCNVYSRKLKELGLVAKQPWNQRQGGPKFKVCLQAGL